MTQNAYVNYVLKFTPVGSWVKISRGLSNSAHIIFTWYGTIVGGAAKNIQTLSK